MKFLSFLMLILTFSLVSCSSGNKMEDPLDDAPVATDSLDLKDEEELEGVEIVGENVDELPADLLEEEILVDNGGNIVTEKGQDVYVQEDNAVEVDALTEEAYHTESQTPVVHKKVSVNANVENSYVVQSGDTLMLVAFKIYGDYTRWRELADLNRDALKGSLGLTKGTSLRYNPPTELFSWSPEGNPYLIQKGDTLGLISNNVYGTQKRWKDIWDNNRPLIKDPNLIFAGFTIYYIPGDRSMASF